MDNFKSPTRKTAYGATRARLEFIATEAQFVDRIDGA